MDNYGDSFLNEWRKTKEMDARRDTKGAVPPLVLSLLFFIHMRPTEENRPVIYIFLFCPEIVSWQENRDLEEKEGFGLQNKESEVDLLKQNVWYKKVVTLGPRDLDKRSPRGEWLRVGPCTSHSIPFLSWSFLIVTDDQVSVFSHTLHLSLTLYFFWSVFEQE